MDSIWPVVVLCTDGWWMQSKIFGKINLATAWRRGNKTAVCYTLWQPTPVLLPEKFHGLRNLVGYSPQRRKESDVTERIH